MAEIIDSLIVAIVLFFALLFVFKRIKKVLSNSKGDKCSKCEELTCNIKQRQNGDS